MKQLTPLQWQILDLLPIGAEHPKQGAIIAQRLNITMRGLHDEIAYLVNEVGVPIGSSRKKPAGYYIIATDEELNTTASALEAQALSELKRISHLRNIDLDKWWDAVG